MLIVDDSYVTCYFVIFVLYNYVINNHQRPNYFIYAHELCKLIFSSIWVPDDKLIKVSYFFQNITKTYLILTPLNPTII